MITISFLLFNYYILFFFISSIKNKILSNKKISFTKKNQVFENPNFKFPLFNLFFFIVTSVDKMENIQQTSLEDSKTFSGKFKLTIFSNYLTS